MNKAVFDCNFCVKHLRFLDLVHAAQALLIAGAQRTNDNTGLDTNCTSLFATILEKITCKWQNHNFV